MKRVAYLLVLTSVLIGCGGGANAERQATLDAISAAVRATATFQAAGGQNPLAAVETAQAEATSSGQSAVATQAALDALSGDARTATAVAAQPIIAELPKFGVDPAAGHVGWIHPPVTLEVAGFMTYDYVNHFIATVAKDFVVSGDITWNTQYGTSGCGFVLRSDGNKNALNQYMAILTRGASGHLLFTFMVDGDVLTGRDIYAYGRDPNFKPDNNTTNRLTVVGRGTRFQIYTNDTLLGEIDASAPPALPGLPDPPQKPNDPTDLLAMSDYQIKLREYNEVVDQINAEHAARQRGIQNANTVFERGFIALVVLSESGESVCEFNNTWLWLMD